MSKTLVILEVSQKQKYIFLSKKLRENVLRSNEINYVTSPAFFEKVASEYYHETENFIYTGGGHAVLQFADEEQARKFTEIVTEHVLRQYEGLELFAKKMLYDTQKTPGENLKELTKLLEQKKSVRKASFRRMHFGIGEKKERFENRQEIHSSVRPPQGWEFPSEFEKLARDENFIAVVHIDGNAMGKRVEGIYKNNAGTWEECCRTLRKFSEGIQRDFETAFDKTVTVVCGQFEQEKDRVLPIRPVILAGDDVCFVTKASIGLECARVFLEQLTKLTNAADGCGYAACAGVALVHTKFPFYQAYQLAEELCSSAKKFGSSIDETGAISAMDWHIEFGQLKENLGSIREEYETEDENRLELRPVAVIAPDCYKKAIDVRTYDFVKCLCQSMDISQSLVARSKMKQFREALKQGEVESAYYMHDKRVFELLSAVFTSKYLAGKYEDKLEDVIKGKEFITKEIFREIGGEKRCLIFDAIEMMDHYQPFEGVQK